MPKKKKKKVFQPKKRLRFRKSYRRRRPRPLTVSPNISSQTYETEEVYGIPLVHHICPSGSLTLAMNSWSHLRIVNKQKNEPT